MVFLLPLIDASRLKLATRGNKTEQIPPLVWSLLLSVPSILGYIFFMQLQTYV